MKHTSRRKFLAHTALAGIGTAIASPALARFANTDVNISSNLKTGFDQTPLAYDYKALEPSIDGTTMDIHYNKHAATYSKNLKEAAVAEKVDAGKSVEDVLAQISKYSAKMRNNAGGHFNHELFWKNLSPADKTGTASDKLAAAINKAFGSMDEFKKQFSEAAKTRFGSGWAWLIKDGSGGLKIVSTPNQDNPLMDIAEVKGTPLLGLDVWEHAYYLKYQNRRPEYIENFWKVVNWNAVSERFGSI